MNRRINMLSMKKNGAFVQFIKFNVVGLLNTAIDFAVYAVLIWAGAAIAIAQPIAYGAGMLNSYIWNSRFTFGADGNVAGRDSVRTIVRFIIWNVILLGISTLLLLAFDKYTSLNELFAKAAVTVLIVVVNFIGSKRFVFRNTRG